MPTRDEQVALTVVIPAFNSSDTLERAVRSAQRIQLAKVLVVDDGSTDETAEIATSLGVDVIRQKNQGASKARARGLTEATTEFVIFLDADDELEPLGVTQSIEALSNSPELVVAAGRVNGVMPDKSEMLLPRATHADSALQLIIGGRGPWPPAAAVIRTTALTAASRLPIEHLSTKFAEDYELMIRLSLVGALAQHDTISVNYRLFSGKSSLRPSGAIADKELIRGHYADALNVSVELLSPRQIRTAGLLRSARVASANQHRILAAVCALRAVLTSPHFFARKASGAISWRLRGGGR